MKKLRVFLLVAVLVFSLAVPAFAYNFNGSDLPDNINFNGSGTTGTFSLIEFWQDFKSSNPDANILIIYYSDSYRLYVSKYGFYRASGGSVNFKGNETVSTYTVSGDQWVFSVNTQATENKLMLDNPSYYRWSAADVLNADNTVWKTGDVNFTPPPPALQEIILEVVGEEMTVAAPQMGGTMKTLALCGVGLMASLVVLKLFGKKSLIFLRK